MRIVFLAIIFLSFFSCKNDASQAESADMKSDNNDTTEIANAEEDPESLYTPETDENDNTLLIIDGTKMLEGELNPETKTVTYRVQGSTSKEMVIQLISQNQDIYYDLRVEGGETITEKQRKYMFTVASNDVL